MKLVIRAAVRRDLSDIAAYISRDNPDRAVTFAQELTASIRKLAERPLIHAIRANWGADLRALLHANYFIIFRVGDNQVIVLRILHSAGNIPDLL